MKFLSKCIGWAAVALVFALAVGACKKRGEAVKSDLNEAGYQLTTEDWFRANRENDVAVLKKFLAAGFPMDRRNEGGDSALHAAAAAGASQSNWIPSKARNDARYAAMSPSGGLMTTVEPCITWSPVNSVRSSSSK